ncbi:Hypothetical predicted protein [Paramuricea clavata]|uniref:Uncharacterized protein n=1 Tax=Paramuricea clavata TaxID=317549 RepID=A0A6S7J9X5_PARCT|nr:Hypothetical predicted protein [Paramuricea clavata]
MAGRVKLELTDPAECQVFDKSDGTEIDDVDCLATYEKGSVFIIGKEWKPVWSEDEGCSRPIGNMEGPTKIDSWTGDGGIVSSEEVTAEENRLSEDVELTEGLEDFGETSNQLHKESIIVEDNQKEQRHEEKKMNEGEIERGKKRTLMEELLDSDFKKKKTFEGHKDDEPTVTRKLMDDQFRHAKMKGIKIFKEEEIKKSKAELERIRKRFWNEKAEQLSTHPSTAKLSKSAFNGIIDVAWTLRKTSFIEDDARKLDSDETDLFPYEDSTTTTRKLGKQKKNTIPKNLDRMDLAHKNLLKIDKKVEQCREKFSKAKTAYEKDTLVKQYNALKTILNGVYTELKRAQDAAVKSIRHKKHLLNKRLMEKSP